MKPEDLIQAIELIIEYGASTSMLQLKLTIGYNKANKFMDMAEQIGIVGKLNGTKARDVLITSIDQINMVKVRECFLLMNAPQKRYLIRNTYDTAIKNKLDEKLRAEFRKHLHKIITGLDIPKFKILHAQIQKEYLSAGGRCKPFEYRDSVKHFTPTSSRTNFMIYVTDGYWIELIEVNETPFD